MWVVVAETSSDPTYHISPVCLRNPRTDPGWVTAPVVCTPATSVVAISLVHPSPDKVVSATDLVCSLLPLFQVVHVPAWEIGLAVVAQPHYLATLLVQVAALRHSQVTSPVQVVAILIGPALIPSPAQETAPADLVQESISVWNGQATALVVAQPRCPATSLVQGSVIVRALVTDPARAIVPVWVTVQVLVTDLELVIGPVQGIAPESETAQVLATGPALVTDPVRVAVAFSVPAFPVIVPDKVVVESNAQGIVPTGRTVPVNDQATSTALSSGHQRIGPSSMGTSITTTSAIPSSTTAQAG
jgi:hypothetical protein